MCSWVRFLIYSSLIFCSLGQSACKRTEHIDWQKGKITLFAGTGQPGYSGDGDFADRAQLNGPAGLAVDDDDNIYVADLVNCVIRKIDSKTRIIKTVAGCGQQGDEGDGGPALRAKLNRPEGVFVSRDGNLYIADSGNHRLKRVDAKTGIIKNIAGCGMKGYSGDGGSALEAKLNHPAGVVVDSQGNVYFNDYANDRIRKVDEQGIISTYAGTGVAGYSGDGGPAIKARINDVYGMAIDRNDDIYLIDSLNFAVRKIDFRTGIISTIIGKGRPGPVVEFASIEDSFLGGTPHPKGTIGAEVPHAVEIDSSGNVFIGDTGANRIRMVDLQKKCVFTVAGTGRRGWSRDNGHAREAELEVHGLRIDSKGRLFFVDFHHHIVRMIEFAPR